MSAPSMDPYRRPPATVPAANRYAKGSPVWVYRGGRWRPGRILAASAAAATVRYRPVDTRGTAVDTVLAVCLVRRVDDDPIDRPQPRGLVAPPGISLDQAATGVPR